MDENKNIETTTQYKEDIGKQDPNYIPDFKVNMPAELLLDSTKVLTQFIDEATIQLTKEGLVIERLDNENICLIKLNIPKSNFYIYNVPESVDIGLNLEELFKILRNSAKKGYDLSLEKIDNSKIKLRIYGKNTKEYELYKVDLAYEKPTIPKIDFNAKATLINGYLYSAVKELKNVSDKIMFEVDGRNVNLSVDNDSIKSKITIGEDGIIECYTDNGILQKANFPIGYILNFLKTLDKKTSVTAELKTDAPIKLTAKLSDQSLINLWVAPRIEGV